MPKEGNSGSAIVRDVILGGQDGLVNVLGIVLAVAEATSSVKVVLIAGLAATFAESISMAAVAYTSAKAGKEFYEKEKGKLGELYKTPEGKTRISAELQKYSIQGTLLNKAVQYVMATRGRFEQALTSEISEQQEEFEHPIRDAIVVGVAAIIGSIIPLIAFFLLPVNIAIWTTLGISTLTLFISGAIKGTYTGTNSFRSGLEMAIVGMTAAIAGYLIGKVLGVTIV